MPPPPPRPPNPSWFSLLFTMGCQPAIFYNTWLLHPCNFRLFLTFTLTQLDKIRGMAASDNFSG